VAYLEGRGEEHTHMVSDLREDMAALRNDMNRRFEQVDKRFDQVDQRFLHLEGKVDLRFDAIDAKLSRQFLWLAGMLMTTLIAILGTFGAIIAAGVGPR
jgi:hypothetical protein